MQTEFLAEEEEQQEPDEYVPEDDLEEMPQNPAPDRIAVLMRLGVAAAVAVLVPVIVVMLIAGIRRKKE